MDATILELEREVATDARALPRLVMALARAGRLPVLGQEPIVCVEVRQTEGLKALRRHPWGTVFSSRYSDTWWSPMQARDDEPNPLQRPYLLCALVTSKRGVPYAARGLSRRHDPTLAFATADELATWLASMTVTVRLFNDPCREVMKGAFPGETFSCSLRWWHRGDHKR